MIFFFAYRWADELKEFQSTMRCYKTSPMEFLSVSTPLSFLCLDITFRQPHVFVLEQKTFVDRTKEAKTEDAIRDGKISVATGNVGSFFKKRLGCLLRTLQTRLDAGYRVIAIATAIASHTNTVEDIMKMTREINRAIRFIKEKPLEITFRPLFGKIPLNIDEQMAGIRVFIFEDAGFASPPGKKSIECGVAVGGRDKQGWHNFMRRHGIGFLCT